MTATIPPTSTPAPTATSTIPPTPTEIPLPETEAIKELQEAYKAEGMGYELDWSKTREGQIAIFYTNPEKIEIPEFVINPDTGEGTRVYIFDNPAGSTEELTVKYAKEELIARNFSGWRIINGKWEVDTAEREDPATKEISETEFRAYSMQEAIEILISATEQMPEGYDRSGSSSRLVRLLKPNGGEITINNIKFKAYKTKIAPNNYWYDTGYYFWNDNTSSYDKVNTLFYAFCSLGEKGEYGYFAFDDANGIKQGFFIDLAKISDFSIKEIGLDRPKGTGTFFRVD